MFKINFEPRKKEIVKQKLQLTEEDTYEFVLCEDSRLIEKDKINLIFEFAALDTVAQNMQFMCKHKYKSLVCHSMRGDEKIALNEIYYIESFGNEISAVVKGRKLQIASKLYILEEELKEFGFIRISKSIVVNVGNVEAIARGFNGKLMLTMSNQEILEVNRSFVKDFKAFIEKR